MEIVIQILIRLKKQPLRALQWFLLNSVALWKKKTNLLSNDPDFGKIADNVPDGESIEVQGKQDYSTNFNDNSWAGVNLNIDRVSVVKTTDIKDYSDNQYNGFVAVHYNIDNTQQDVSYTLIKPQL